MEKKRLGDICEIVTGATPKTNIKEFWDGDINWITPAELTEDTYIINESLRKITTEGVEKTGLKSFPKGTVILSSRAPIGKVAIAGYEMYCNQGFKNLICSKQINNRFLYWYLKGHKEYLNSLGRGATFKEISKEIVENIEICLPTLEKQEKYADILEQCNGIIQIKKGQLRKLETLVKSRSAEMFGNPRTNSKGFQTKKGSDLFKISNGKAVPNNHRFKTGISAYGGNGISWYTDNVLYEHDTIVIGRVGFQSGNVHLVKGPVWVTDNAMYISDFLDDSLSLFFLCEMMEQIDFTKYQDAGDLKKVTQKPFMDMDYIVPSKKLQQQFSDFVVSTDKSK